MNETPPNKRRRNPAHLATAFVVVSLLAIGAVGIYLGLRNTAGPSGLGGSWSYDIKNLAVTDPNIVGYKELGPIDTGMAEPRGIAIDANGDLLVVGDRRMAGFAPGGAASAYLSLEFDEPPLCVAADARGHLLIGFAHSAGRYIDGKLPDNFPKDRKYFALGRLALDAKSRVTSVALGGGLDPDMFVADAGNRVVWRYDHSGTLLGKIGGKEPNRDADGFVIPSPHFDLAMGRDTLLRIVNPGRHRIEAYTPGGDMELAWGQFDNADIAGFCGCCNPTDIAILPDGSFVTSEKGLARVKVYDPNGVFRCVVAGTEAFTEGVTGLDLAAGRDGKIYVLDPAAKAVRVFVKK